MRTSGMSAPLAGLFALALLCPVALDARSADAEWLEAIKQVTAPLKTPADLDPVIEAGGATRVVLLGEASHGTSEFYTWRAKISQRLIAEKKFSFIAVEGDWASIHRLNRYVKGLDDADDARAILRQFDRWPLWMWANEEVAELAEWMRAYNKDRPLSQRAGFYGIDVYGWENSIQAVVEYLRDASPELARRVQTLYGAFALHRSDASSYARAVARGDSSQREVAQVVELLRKEREKLESQNAAAYFAAKQNALVVQNAEAHVRKMSRPGPDSWNARARHMKLTVARLKEFYGEGARAIVWAHNTHIGDARATPMAQFEQVNIGQLARERWGDEAVFLLGFATHRGEVLAGRAWGAPRVTMPVPPAQAGSVESILNQLQTERALLTFRNAEIPKVLEQVRGHRAIGVLYNPEREAGNYVPTRLPRRYDALIFLAETKPLRPLHEDGEVQTESRD
jgi:erythromycin esterase